VKESKIRGKNSSMMFVFLFTLLLLSAHEMVSSNLRGGGPFQAEESIDVDPAAMAGNTDDLTDDQLHLSHGTLTPAKLSAMKTEMVTLQKSLGSLMDKQTELTTQYKIEKEREVEDKALKKTVRQEVARSLLKNLDQQSQSRTEFMSNIVDKAISKVKDQYDISEMEHPDHPNDTDKDATGAEESVNDAAEESASGAAAEESASGAATEESASGAATEESASDTADEESAIDSSPSGPAF
jgi:membrane protein involved in colicin uptake